MFEEAAMLEFSTYSACNLRFDHLVQADVAISGFLHYSGTVCVGQD